MLPQTIANLKGTFPTERLSRVNSEVGDTNKERIDAEAQM
jgi:hypothetical protein